MRAALLVVLLALHPLRVSMLLPLLLVQQHRLMATLLLLVQLQMVLLLCSCRWGAEALYNMLGAMRQEQVHGCQYSQRRLGSWGSALLVVVVVEIMLLLLMVMM